MFGAQQLTVPHMLGDFMASHRDELLTRARLCVAERNALLPAELASTLGLPVFFDQIRVALGRAASSKAIDHTDLKRSAAVHGHALFTEGFTVADVVHDYGDLCRVIMRFAAEQNAMISAAELQTLNLCLEDAVAGAVTEHGRQRERTLAQEVTERAGMLAHEMRNYLNTAMLALSSLKSGAVGTSGATSGILDRSLTGLHTLIERSVASVRMEVARDVNERVLLREVIEQPTAKNHLPVLPLVGRAAKLAANI